MSDWKRELKREGKRKEIKSNKDGKKMELEKFKKAEMKLNKAKNRRKITKAIKKELVGAERAIGTLASKLKRDQEMDTDPKKRRK
jgi:hypothetical protein